VIDVTATAQIDWTFRVGDQVKLRLVNSGMMFSFNVTAADPG
jgi:hypothetical protein